MKHILSNLNEAQLQAVTTTEGPVLVLAGAGSGKTRVIAVRAAYLIAERKAKPHNILAVTFTNKAAEEMRERILKLLDQRNISKPFISTFHSLCAKILRREISHLQEGYTSEFTIYDTDDSLRAIKNIIGADEKKLNPKVLQRYISGAKNLGIELEEYLEETPQIDQNQKCEILKVAEKYQKSLNAANALDFDDLLLKTVQLLKYNDSIREKYSDFFKYIMIDEYQDTNPMQFALIKLLTSTHDNVCVVGDDNQSIYAFRHADIRNILDFEKHYPKAKVIKLEQNYRSTKNILSVAEEIIKNNKNRKPKRLWTENEEGEKVYYFNAINAEDEARFVVTRIKEILQENPNQKIAVLYRTNYQSRLFEEMLRKQGLRYRIVGALSFYQRAEIKEITAYLKVILNPSDSLSLERIINVPPRGIGDATLNYLNQIAIKNEITLWDAILLVTSEDQFHKELPQRSIQALKSFKNLIEYLQKETAKLQNSPRPVSDTVSMIIKETGYEKMLLSSGDTDDLARLENLEELLNASVSYDDRENGLREFVDNASLVSSADSYDEAERITLMTIHAAKGLEFPVVFLVGMENGLFPHFRSMNQEKDMEEERRLCYVAITRAMKTLYITHATERRSNRETYKNEPSLFLKEIPKTMLEDISEIPSWLSKQETDKQELKTYDFLEAIKKSLLEKGIKFASDESSFESQSIHPGDYVLHKRYGRGMVLRKDGKGKDAKLTINFPGFGQKKILAKFVEKA
ncbi:MAG: UvrD-helicase domain-containing protein [Pyrinomonadaceae bacterium]|nr:UvrD-helicase domain-containing protein [Pyrinomonadaceae bacterium]MCX7639053.1 UvrD-helicase domain-containing protein [Pyrinomonadaceae bacterium]MDW8303726.1 3'-5' exonuclease [Acidobacteriota bacterium]